MRLIRFLRFLIWLVCPSFCFAQGYRAELATTRRVNTNLVTGNGKIYFVSGPSYNIYENNKLDTVTKSVAPDVTVKSDLFVANNNLLFLGKDSTGYNLFETHLPAYGVTRIAPFGFHGNYIGQNIIEKDSNYFFIADRYDTAHHQSNIGLYRSNGSAGNCTLVKLIQSYPYYDTPAPVVIANYISRLYKMNNSIYFFAPSDSNQYVLWVSDGTTAGTNVLIDKSFLTFPAFDIPRFIEYDRKVYFKFPDTANTGEHQLWVTDGTDTGTHQFKTFFSSSFGCHDIFLRVCNNNLYIFPKRFETIGIRPYGQLWVSDGTLAGTSFLNDYSVVYDDGIDTLKDKLYYTVQSVAATDTTLLACNTLTNSITNVNSAIPDIKPSLIVQAIKSWDNNLFYGNTAVPKTSCDLYSTDGSAANTLQVDSPTMSITKAFNGINASFYPSDADLYFTGRYLSATGNMSLFKLVKKSPLAIPNYGNIVAFSVYPNPVSDYVDVTYTLQKNEPVRIVLTDMSGKKVTTFMNKQQQSPGDYNFHFNICESVKSGIYFMYFTAGNFSTSIKVEKR